MDELDRLLDGARGPDALDPHLGEAADAGAEAEGEAVAAQLVHRGRGHGREHGVADEGIGHHAAELKGLGVAGGEGQVDEDVPVEALVGEPHPVEAQILEQPNELDEPRRQVFACKPHPEAHVGLPFLTFTSEPVWATRAEGATAHGAG